MADAAANTDNEVTVTSVTLPVTLCAPRVSVLAYPSTASRYDRLRGLIARLHRAGRSTEAQRRGAASVQGFERVEAERSNRTP